MAKPPYPEDPLFVKWAIELRVKSARENGFWTGVATTLSVMACVAAGVLWFRP